MSILFPAAQKAPIDPVCQLLNSLHGAGRENFTAGQPWESCLCALALALNPRLRAEQVLEALPWRSVSLDEGVALNVFAHLGYLARPVRANLHDIDPRLLPCLFVSARSEPIVLLKEEGERLILYRKGGVISLPKERAPNSEGTAWIIERFDERPIYFQIHPRWHGAKLVSCTPWPLSCNVRTNFAHRPGTESHRAGNTALHHVGI